MSAIEGKRVLLLGASSGIGAAAAELFAREGARLALVARGEGLDAVAERARAHGARVTALRADVSDRDALARAIADAEDELGGLDVAALNVGVAAWGPFGEVAAADFDRVVDVTFRAAVDATRLVLPALERSGGALVLTGSVGGRIPLPLMTSYTAAKHALHGFAGALRIELRAQGSPVTVTVVAPGPVDTPFWQHASSPAGRSAVAPRTLPYAAGDVAGAIVEAARGHRREVTVGGLMVLARASYSLAGGLAEAAMAAVVRRLLADRDGSPADRATLARPTGEGQVDTGLRTRPSVAVGLWRAAAEVGRAVRARAG